MSMAMLPELPEQSKAKIRVVANFAKANIRDARRQLDLADRTKSVYHALEFSVSASGERFELDELHAQRVQTARERAQTAAVELFDVYAAEYWQMLCPEVEKFSDLLTAIGDHVENELACHELTTSIRDAISEKTFCWMQRSAREIFQVRPEPQPAPATHSAPEQGEAKQTYKTPLARNIDNLRKECGWSLDDLSKATAHDKKLILGHLQGKGAYPSTLKAYADAFSEKLGRPVLVADLDPATD